MIRLIILAALVGVLVSGCGPSRAQRIEAADKRVGAIRDECRDKRLRGELSGHLAKVKCGNSRVRAEFEMAGYPYMDLIDLRHAYRLAWARRINSGEMTEEDFELQKAELNVRINSEEFLRDNVERQSAAQEAAAMNALLRPHSSIRCSTFANTITCN